MRPLDELNMNEGGEAVDRSPPTDSVISQFEEHFGVVLPTDYLTFLRFSNGGGPELSSIVPISGSPADRRNVDHFYHVSDDRSSQDSLWKNTADWQATVGKNYVPFATDGGGNQFMLDFSRNPPSIVQCIHDDELHFIAISNDFRDFIDGLELDPDMI